MKSIFFELITLSILFLGNIIINNYNYYFLLIYSVLIIYHLYIFIIIIKDNSINTFEIKNFILISFLLFLFTYFFICDPNPFFCFIFYYIFFPNFIKGVVIIIIHTYCISNIIRKRKKNLNHYNEEFFFKRDFKKKENKLIHSYFIFHIIFFLKKKNAFEIAFLCLILFLILSVLFFENRINIWTYYFDKQKTLPISYSKNRIFYITSNIINIEDIIEIYIEQMKKLINYLGAHNVIISIVENGDSVDNTRQHLNNFKNYLSEKNILNKFILSKEIKDIRKNVKPFIKGSRLRIEFYAKLRNKCLDYLYEIPNIDLDNIIVIYLNDVIFKYQDIINLLSTNKEDFDLVCGLDMFNHNFYDRWVSVDLDGNGLKRYFPYFINKEAQDLVWNHRPIRVFSCWNGVLAFKASALKNKRVKFRHKGKYTLPKFLLNNPNKNYYESECTYFNIDLFSAGYLKKFINPDVRVVYEQKDYFYAKYYIPSILHIIYSFILYFIGFCRKRNKFMSNYFHKDNKLNNILNNWYLENRK